jgi:acetyl-CoA C-acetyltransferase
MELDPRTPVIVGVGQLTQRTNEGAEYLEPVEMQAEAVRRAIADSGAPGLLRHVDSLRLPLSASGRYPKPVLLLAERLGLGGDAIDHEQMQYILGGGEMCGAVLAGAAADIARGDNDVIVLASAEAWFSQVAADRSGVPLPLTRQPAGTPAPLVLGDHVKYLHQHEKARGILDPVDVYPLFENAWRRHQGRSVADHQEYLGRFWERLSSVAVTNPYAWDRVAHTASEIATPTARNRDLGFPYTKLLVSNEKVDEAAAIVLCSVERADALGIDRDRWVFPLGATSGETWTVVERWDVHSSPMAALTREALRHEFAFDPAGADLVDVYSCFPSAVQLQAVGLGIVHPDRLLSRDLTVTGGMSFSGGPWSVYPMHGMATMVDRVRDAPGSTGLCTANGGALSKLVTNMFSGRPPRQPFRIVSVQEQCDVLARRVVNTEPSGPATIETLTVKYDRTGSAVAGFVLCLMPDESRAIGVTHDEGVMQWLTSDGAIGTQVRMQPDGSFDVVT